VSGPLSHIRVVEMGSAIQGPAAGLYLRDMGAEVIKIEPPTGDANRGFRGVNNDLPPETFGSQFVAMNRGKKSVCLDVHTALGLKAVLALIQRADVFVSNYRESALIRMGLAYETVSADNPSLIYALGNGFGPRGPDADKTMLDGAAIARGGLASMTCNEETGPIPPGATIADTGGGLLLALAITTALAARAEVGRGQKVQSSALGAQLWLQMWELTHVWMTGSLLKPGGAHHDNMRGPYGVYRTADGGHFFFAAAQSNESWDQFWVFVDDPAEALNPKWSDPSKRFGIGITQADAREIQARMREAFLSKTTAEWQAFLSAQPEIVSEYVQNYDEVRRDPQVVANDYVESMNIDGIGETAIVGNLVSFSETPASTKGLPPGLGADTAAVLQEIGFSQHETDLVIEEATERRNGLLANLAAIQSDG
jgi:crotonobetainyl-CoA:carnitine CoA-transferase CaiB-like acyl-CoA transferase